MIVITDDEFRYALITTKVLSESVYAYMMLEDIAWLNPAKIRGDESIVIRDVGVETKGRPGDEALEGEAKMQG